MTGRPPILDVYLRPLRKLNLFSRAAAAAWAARTGLV